MDTSTKTHSPCASTKLYLPLAIVPLQDASTAPRSPSCHELTDGTLLPNVKQSPPNPQNNCIVIIQNNYIAEGGTINIFSSHCNGSSEFFVCLTDQKTHLTMYKAVTKLEHVAATAEPTPFEPPPATQAEPAERGPESIVLSGNTFGECVMINVGSPNCTGAGRSFSSFERNLTYSWMTSVKQTALDHNV
jgi:hypothetical protein